MPVHAGTNTNPTECLNCKITFSLFSLQQRPVGMTGGIRAATQVFNSLYQIEMAGFCNVIHES